MTAERAAPGLLFGLALDGVFRALEITFEAVGSYPTFSPLPSSLKHPISLNGIPGGLSQSRRLKELGGLIFCGTGPSTKFRNTVARVYLSQNESYTASHPIEFGLSSLNTKLRAILRLSKISQ